MGDSNEPHSQKRVEDPADIDPDAAESPQPGAPLKLTERKWSKYFLTHFFGDKLAKGTVFRYMSLSKKATPWLLYFYVQKTKLSDRPC